MLARSAKVQVDLKKVHYTGVARNTNPPCLGMGFHTEWLRLSRPEATHVERELRRGPSVRVAA